MANPGTPFNAQSALFQWSEQTLLADEAPKPADSSTQNIELLISCLDLTSLKATDTPESIELLLEQARHPVGDKDLQVAAVCVFQPFVAESKLYFEDRSIEVATVAGGFPHGQLAADLKAAEVKRCVKSGADEVDIVINRTYSLLGHWQHLYDEIHACKVACGEKKLKVILATGDLKEPILIYKSAMVAMMAGADFIKTSTGMEAVNATIPAGWIMMQAIKAYAAETGVKVGIKPAGGIRTTDEALGWLALLQQELGDEWCNPRLFRIGASSLLQDLVKHL